MSLLLKSNFSKRKESDKLDSIVNVYEDGTPKDFCKWHARYNEVKQMMQLDTEIKQINNIFIF